MTDERESQLDAATHARAERIVAERLQQVRQDETLAVYKDLLDSIWARLEPTLGGFTVQVLFDRALTRSAKDYPLLSQLSVTPGGVEFEALREVLAGASAPEEVEASRVALRELILQLFDLLGLLTGDIIVRRLLAEMDGDTQSNGRPAPQGASLQS
ncbi:hypothetical protein [Alienimonas chondri]|uniref:Uncharacterized protein n=1 Tax=Alienimonas chondri TaxID=2681879 RepID=A0ABX1V841_9PLAN|nr:hypothetical protein [Alienimonas chondri]NNJ24340.1 hypothetical protein [Alienimonas chondri]